MPNTKKAGPSLLCEWMVGTTIRSALGPPPPPPKPKSKPKRRDIIKLHVTTDDESGEDTLTITYPRSDRLGGKGEAGPQPVSESEPEPEPEPKPEVVEVVKKVRFEKEAVPKKSAMKKKTSVTFCEVEETKSDSSADATSTSASSGEATPEASSSNASSAAETSSAGETSSDGSHRATTASKPTRPSRSKKTEKPTGASESKADSEPHPTCGCNDCASGRRRKRQQTVCEKKKCKKNDKTPSRKKKEPEFEQEPESSASEIESSAEEKPTPPRKSKARRKEKKKKTEASDAEGETSSSAKETGAESEEQPKKSPEKTKTSKNGDKAEKAEKKANAPKAEEVKKAADEEKDAERAKEAEEAKKAEDAKSEKSTAGKGKEKEADDSKKPAAAEAVSPSPRIKDMGQRLQYYPEGGYHYSHSRAPNLIAPIRAEVMQTERVVETQDDPPPNAYYDALHNVVRVYHGSVYGQNGRHMFAPRDYAAGLGHPSGMPHPMPNPYYPSYNNVMPLHPPQQQLLPPHGYEHVPITQGMPMPGWNAMVPPPGFPAYNYQGGPPPMPAAWYEQHLDKQGTKGAFSMCHGAGGTPDSKGSKNKPREPDNNVMPEAVKPNPYYTRKQSTFSNMGSNRSVSNGKPPSHSGNSNGGGSQRGGKDTTPNWDASSRRSVGAWAKSSNQGATWGDGAAGDANNNQGGVDPWGIGGSGGGDTWGTTNNDGQWNSTGADQWGTGSNNGGWTGSGNDQSSHRGWDTKDNANTGGATWGQGTTNDQKQTNDNNGDGGGQGQGQGKDQNQGQSRPPAGGSEPTAAMADNNVMPAAAVTTPPGEQSKMPGSWYSENDGQAAFVDPPWPAYQPPPGVPEWGDPTLAASTGGQVDQW
ncbi:hypothetical protein Trco_007737 [Trichoderma cornu-damae]|uniref:Uncharacterized protein n=1 Tax=Trichoderma cornu-damae TaxID=654480 RepID=A0A9P8QGA3_9HYPO|nr:hypothetical protein Trco_007737 [Trichoderma cornu-damae]